LKGAFVLFETGAETIFYVDKQALNAVEQAPKHWEISFGVTAENKATTMKRADVMTVT